MPGGTRRYVQPTGRDIPPVKTTEEEGTTSHPLIKAQKEEGYNQEENSVQLNISKWWRRMERSEKRNYNRLDINPKPKRKSRRCTEWKLGYLSLWWMRMDRECHAQRATKEENKMKSSLSKFFFRNNDTKKNNTHNMKDIDNTPKQARTILSSRPVDCHSRTTPVEGKTTDVINTV